MSKAAYPDALKSQKNGTPCDSEGKHDPTLAPLAAVGESALVGDKCVVKGGEAVPQGLSASETLDTAPPTDPYTLVEKSTFFDPISGVGFSSLPSGTPLGLTILENIAAPCTKFVPYLVGKNAKAGAAVIFKPRCKCWDCEPCARLNADLWSMRATVGAQHFLDQGDTVQLVTVTSHERVARRVAIERLPDNWNRLRNRWQREVGKPAYFLVGETGNKSAHFHLHIITNRSPSQRFWKNAARASGMGYIANESDPLVTAGRAGFYCGKYLAKQFSAGKYKKGYHRVRCSHTWPKLPRLPRDENWIFEPLPGGESLRDIADSLQRQGFHVALADHKTAWAVVDAC